MIRYLVAIFVLSWFIFSEFWIKVVNLYLVDTIACKFNPEKTSWRIGYFIICIPLIAYYINLSLKKNSQSIAGLLPSFIIALTFCVCLYSDNWNFIGYYAHILLVPFIAKLILWSIYFVIKCKNKCIDENYLGLEFEKPLMGNLDEKEIDAYNRNEFIKSTAEKLKYTFDKDIAFAVGISGKWGSGKTSFTNALKKQMSQKSEIDIIIEFKPWFCKTPNDIIDDFFKEYRREISKHVSGLSSNIEKYSNTLRSLEIQTSIFNMPLKYLFRDKSGQEYYERIKKILETAKCKVLIIIDDTDRLNKEEIMEVLRLIRNTANFPYTQFIVTYDKAYITQTMLGSDNEEKAEEYLRKIFNLEINLPSYEGSILCDELKQSLRIIFKELDLNIIPENDIKKVITHKYIDTLKYSETDEYNIESDGKKLDTYKRTYRNSDTNSIGHLIPKILHSKRDVIRFSNSLKLNLLALKRSEQLDCIDIVDFISLELIRYRYTNLYCELRDDPLSLLYLTMDNSGDNSRRSYRTTNTKKKEKDENTQEPDKLSMKLSKLVKPDDYELAEFLLKDLFKKKDKENNQSISNISSYLTYFAYRIDNKNISRAEFYPIVFNPEDSVLTVVEKLFADKNKRQLQERLTNALIDFTDIADNQKAELETIEKLFEFAISTHKKTNITELRGEISSAILSYLEHFEYLGDYFSKIDVNHQKALINLWSYFSSILNYMQIAGKTANNNFIHAMFMHVKITPKISALLEGLDDPFVLSEGVSHFIYNYAENQDSGKRIPINNINDLVQIQINQFVKYITLAKAFDNNASKLSENALRSANKLNDKVLRAEIEELVQKYQNDFSENK